MKKLSLFLLLCIFAFATKAQELNFEETVKYIQGKLIPSKVDWNFGWPDPSKSIGSATYESSNTKEIKFSKNGDVVITVQYQYGPPSFKFNLFKIAAKKEGIEQIDKEVWISENGDSKHVICYFGNPSVVDAERLYKAFIHLRSLCTREKDPFDK